jgi:hypothetical protein
MTDSQKTSLIWLIAVCIALVLAAFWVRNFIEDHQPIPEGAVKAPPAPEVKKVEKVEVTPKAPVKVYKTTPKLKKGLGLPEPIVEAPQEHVLASTKVEPEGRHPHTVITTINEDTGETETYTRTDPLPWFVTSSRGSAGIYMGLKNGTQTARLQVEQELFSVKSVHFGAIATVDQPVNGPAGTDYFIGIGAKYEW